MKHSIFVNDQGIVEMHYVGPISDEENMELIKKSYELITKQIDLGKKPLVLVDHSKSKHFLPSVINTKAMRDSEAIKMAGFGVDDPADRQVAMDTVAKAGAQDHVRLFDNRKQAEAWLNS
jgi:hypothetical protein